LLVRWQINIEITATVDEEEEQFLMALSQAYLEWERQAMERGIERGMERGMERGEQVGRANLVLMQIRSRLGELTPTLTTQIQELPVAKLDDLAIALFDLSTVEQLDQWLQTQQ
jgi:flagellar biosynthesis/type III secretory pathway protein FliH